MVNSLLALDATFSALADPTRRAILARLGRSDTSVTELAHPFSMTLPAVSKHLRVLERAGLLAQEKEGRFRKCSLVAGPMKAAAEWIAHYRRFWEERLDALDRYLNETRQKEDHPWPPRKRAPRSLSRSRGPSRPRARKSSAPGPRRKR